MNDTILAFLDDKHVAIVGASNKKDNFGKYLMTELTKLEYQVHPVNPRCEEIDGIKCVSTVMELPKDVESVILAVPSSLTHEIIDQCIGTPIKRVWMLKGMGKGAYSETAHDRCKVNNIAVVYGLCPMMFYGTGGHKFHFWIRKTFGKLPEEYMN